MKDPSSSLSLDLRVRFERPDVNLKWQHLYKSRLALCCLLWVFAGRSLIAQAPLEVIPQIGHSAAITSVALSGDGRTAVSGGRDKVIEVWELATDKIVRRLLGSTGPINSVALSADGRIAASASEIGTDVLLWDVTAGRMLQRLRGHTAIIQSIALSEHGDIAVTGSMDGTVRIWNTAMGHQLHVLAASRYSVTSVALSADSRVAISGTEDKTVRVWDVANGQGLFTLCCHAGPITSVAVSADGRRALSASTDRTVKLWDAITGKEIVTLGTGAIALSSALSSDGQRAVVGSADATVKVWNIAAPSELLTLQGQPLPQGRPRVLPWQGPLFTAVNSVAISYDGLTALSTLQNFSLIKTWDLRQGQEKQTLHGASDYVTSLAVSTDGRTLVLGDNGMGLRIWDVEAAREMRALRDRVSSVDGVAVSADGRRALAKSADDRFTIWDTITGAEATVLEGGYLGTLCVALSGDGTVAMAGDQVGITVWNAINGKKVGRLEDPGPHDRARAVSSVSLSNDGHTALSYGALGVQLWDVSASKKIDISPNAYKSAALSLDGHTVLFGAHDHSVIIWDVSTGVEVGQFRGHTADVYQIALSSDGQTAVSISDDNNVRVWSVQTHKEISSFFVPGRVETTAFVTPRSNRLILLGQDGDAQIWSSTGVRLLTLAESADGESIAVTPSGYYDASARGEGLIAFVVGGRSSALQSFRGQRNIPAVVRRTLELGDEQRAIEEVVGDNAKQIGELLPLARIAPQEPRPEGKPVPRRVAVRDAASYKLPVYVRSNMGRITHVRSILDEMTKDYPQNLKDGTIEIALNLTAGEHELRVEVEDDKGLRSEDEVSILVETKLPRLFIVAAAASEYAPATKLATLKYAQRDIDRIVAAFQSKVLFSETNVLTLGPKGKARATRETILDALDSQFQDAGESDWLVLYLSGHGDEDDSGQFRFLPEGIEMLSNGQIARAKTIAGPELMAWVKAKRKVGRRYLIVDACYSGQLISKSTHALDSELQNALLQEGTVIITAGWADQNAKESKTLEGSVLTLALTDAMQKAKPDDVGAISLRTTEDYIRDFIKKNGIPEQDPQIWKDPSFGAGPAFPFWLRPKVN